jgi:hypothetical protein
MPEDLMQPINIFRILNVKREEDPHDRMLEWLCDPKAGHGIQDFPAAIIHTSGELSSPSMSNASSDRSTSVRTHGLISPLNLIRRCF